MDPIPPKKIKINNQVVALADPARKFNGLI